MSEQQSQFEGWAILEIFGHQKYAGFVKTEYYGTACMFRLEVPPLPEGRTRILRYGENIDGQYVPAGATVKEGATQPYSKLFGVGALYSMTPCTQEAALKALEGLQPRALMLVSLRPEKAIAASAVADPDDEDDKPDFGFGHEHDDLEDDEETGHEGSDEGRA